MIEDIGISHCKQCDLDFYNHDLDVRRTHKFIIYYCPECSELLRKFDRH